MKKRTKGKLTRTAIYMLILTLAMLSAFPLCAFCADEEAFAYEETVTEGTPDIEADEENAPNTEADEENAPNTEADEEDAPNTEADDEDAPLPTDKADNQNSIFGICFEAISAHASEILSALTFIGSVIIMICYRNGFLPMVKDGVYALSAGVKSLGEHTGTITENTEKLLSETDKKLAGTAEVLEKMASTLATLEAKLATEEAHQNETVAFKTVLSAEVDMLYEIFMSAALPQYLKDKVGTQIAQMKATLGTGE